MMLLRFRATTRFRHAHGSWLIRAARQLAAGALAVLAMGCEQASVDPKPADTHRAEPPPRAVQASPKPTTGSPTNSPTNAPSIDADDLLKRSIGDVAALLGKPQGKIQTKNGSLWLYPHWRVQFDGQDRVLGVEKDFPLPPLAALDPKFLGPKPRPGATAPRLSGTAPAGSRNINVVSNGGQEVDLLALMPDAKVTIVDFYADWCGPCRQASPYLERLAAQDPDVALVKVDIVDWQTPVTRQFNIGSIPNIRVFDRRKAQVGSATHDLRLVFEYVNVAKR